MRAADPNIPSSPMATSGYTDAVPKATSYTITNPHMTGVAAGAVPTYPTNIPSYGWYTCPSCGQYVTGNAFHWCPAIQTCPTQSTTMTWPANKDAEILAELKAIRALLERGIVVRTEVYV